MEHLAFKEIHPQMEFVKEVLFLSIFYFFHLNFLYFLFKLYLLISFLLHYEIMNCFQFLNHLVLVWIDFFIILVVDYQLICYLLSFMTDYWYYYLLNMSVIRFLSYIRINHNFYTPSQHQLARYYVNQLILVFEIKTLLVLFNSNLVLVYLQVLCKSLYYWKDQFLLNYFQLNIYFLFSLIL